MVEMTKEQQVSKDSDCNFRMLLEESEKSLENAQDTLLCQEK